MYLHPYGAPRSALKGYTLYRLIATVITSFVNLCFHRFQQTSGLSFEIKWVFVTSHIRLQVPRINLSVGSILSIVIRERDFDVPTVKDTQADKMFWKDSFIE